MVRTRRLSHDAYTQHVRSDWNAVADKERFTMSEDVTQEAAIAPVEDLGTPAPPPAPTARTTDLKGLASAKHVTVDGQELDVIATSGAHSSWSYTTEGMSCGNCAAIVKNDPDLVFCPHCGVGYVVRAYVGITP